jgi:hypothetical protein
LINTTGKLYSSKYDEVWEKTVASLPWKNSTLSKQQNFLKVSEEFPYFSSAILVLPPH